MPDQTFVESSDTAGYWISRHPVDAVRAVPSLWPLWDRVVASSLAFSGMRLRNAQAREAMG